MEIIVGRNQQTRQLNIIKDGVERAYGQPNSVPTDVSRHHLSLQPAGAGKWQVKNLNERNVTFVNGIAIESKTVSESDKIELGNSHYLFSWSALQEPKVETVDIRSLKVVWDNYQQNEIEIRNRQKNTGLWASVPTGIAFVLFLYGLYRRSQDNSTVELKANQEEFDSKWVCPKCGRPLTAKNYTVLSKLDGCPYCKTKYKK